MLHAVLVHWLHLPNWRRFIR